MDFWKLIDILDSRQKIINPMRLSKLDRFIDILDLPMNSHVLDVGCGKGEFLFRLYERYNASGVGVDISKPFHEQTIAEKEKRAPEADLEFLLMDAADYKADIQFDLTCCMGASWIYGGIKGTLKALEGWTKPGGLIVAGEPYWLKEPDPEYLKAIRMGKEAFHTHMENVVMGDEFGLACSFMMVSDHEDWDYYESLHWRSAAEYVDANPDDPDNSQLLEIAKKDRDVYLRWARDTINWGLYVYRKPLHAR